MTDAKKSHTNDPKLVQVLYDPRFGMQAFFDNGDIATLVNDEWLWAGNIVVDADYNAQAPDGAGTYRGAKVAR